MDGQTNLHSVYNADTRVVQFLTPSIYCHVSFLQHWLKIPDKYAALAADSVTEIEFILNLDNYFFNLEYMSQYMTFTMYCL